MEGTAMKVTLHDYAKAIAAMDADMALIEKQQLALADSMYHMIRQQAKLGQRYKALKLAIEKCVGAASS